MVVFFFIYRCSFFFLIFVETQVVGNRWRFKRVQTISVLKKNLKKKTTDYPCKPKFYWIKRGSIVSNLHRMNIPSNPGISCSL